MANFKKIDNLDFIFLNTPLTPKEEREFSDFLKIRKARSKTKRPFRKTTRSKKEVAG